MSTSLATVTPTTTPTPAGVARRVASRPPATAPGVRRPPARPPVRRAPQPLEAVPTPTGCDPRTALASGDPAAWEAVVARHRGLVERVARRVVRCRADVDEVVQRTFVSLWTHADRVEDLDRLPGWLATTARREALAVVRVTAREVPTDVTHSDGPAPDAAVHQHLLSEELSRALHAAVAELPQHQRRLIEAMLADDMSYDDISASLGIPRGSIGPTRARAIAALRERLVPAFA